MYSSKQLKKWIEKVYCPCVITASSKSADTICLDSGLTFCNLLEPFCDVKGVNVSLRSSESSFLVKDFKLQLIDLRMFKPMDQEVIDANLRTTLEQNQLSKETMNKIISQRGGMLPLEITEESWYPKYEETLIRGLKFQEFDLIDHPVALFIAVGSSESDPIKKFDDLANKILSQKPFTKGLYEKNIPIFYFLLHDNCTDIDAKSILKQMKSRFSANSCKLLAINSIPKEEYHGLLPMFKDVIAIEKANGAIPGCRLSEDDCTLLSDISLSIIKKGILNNIEKRCYQYSSDIIAERKGLKNAFKSWLRTPRDATSEIYVNEILYDSDTTEFKIRCLADLSFMVHDYTTAIDNYKMILDDFKNDNSNAHYANTLEMLLFSEFMSGSVNYSTLYNTIKMINSAYQKYQSKIISHIISRVLFMASNFQSCSDLWKGSNRNQKPNFGLVMVKHSEKESIEMSSMLLDQAGKVLRDYNNSSKSGFQYIMAGYMYNKMNILSHSIRCYIIALSEYNNKGWKFIENHIYRTLQQRVMNYSSSEQSLRYFNECINCPYQTVDKQKEIFDMFWTTILSIPVTSEDSMSHKNILLQHFPLPQLDMSSIRVLIQDNAIDSQNLIPLNGSLRYTNGWTPLYNAVSYSRLNVTSILGNSNDPVGKVTQLVIGQTYIIEIMIINPLELPLSITNLHLNIIRNNEDTTTNTTSSNDTISDSIYSESQNLFLTPKEKRVIQLHVHTLKAGQFKVESMQWTLSNTTTNTTIISDSESSPSINVDYPLEIKGKKLRKTFEQRVNGVRKIEKCLELNVIEDEPYLGFKIEYDRETVFKNEILPLNIQMSNKGITDIEKVVLFTDIDSFYYDDNNSKEIESLTPSSSSPIDFEDDTNINYYSLIKNNSSLKSLQNLEQQAYIHVPSSNTINIKFLILYCGHNNIYKMLRYEIKINCVSLLSNHINIIPHPIHKTSSLLQTLFENHSHFNTISSLIIKSSTLHYYLSSFIPSQPFSLQPNAHYSCFSSLEEISSKSSENSYYLSSLPSLYVSLNKYIDAKKNDNKDTCIQIDCIWTLENGQCGFVRNTIKTLEE